MKVNSIHLKDFRIHERLSVPLDNITVIVGPNGSGKSSIKAALEYALTGRCEWTDGRGAGADGLTRDGAKKAAVALDIEGIGVVKREIPNSLEVEGLQGSTTQQQAILMQKLGATEQIIGAALNTTGFLNLDRATQKTLLFDLLGFSFTRKDVAGRVAQAVGERRAEAASEWVSKELEEGTYGPQVFGVLEERAVTDRRAMKRRLKELEALAQTPVQVRLPDGVTLEDRDGVMSQLQAVWAERDELMKRLGEAKAQADARAARVRQVEGLRRSLQKAEETLVDVAGASPENTAQMRQVVGSVGLRIDQVTEERARTAATLAAAHTKRDTLAKALESISKATGKCPLAPGVVSCPMSAEDLKALTKKLETDLKAAEKDIEKAQETLLALDREIAGLRKQKANMESEVAEVERAVARYEDAKRAYEAFRASLAQAEADLANAPEPPDVTDLQAQIDTLSQRIARGDELLQLLRRYELAAEAQKANIAEWRACQEELELVEALCDALGPKGIRAQILGEAVAALEKHANEHCQALTRGEYSIEFRVDEDLEILVTRAGYGPRSVSQLSASEKFRVGLVVQDVLNSLTDVRLLVIDGADILDVENRALMMNMLLEIREDYDTILVLSTLGDVAPADPGIPGVSVYVLQDGELVAAPKAA
ncbi:MAG: ATP-binding protein [Bacillota bacterium]